MITILQPLPVGNAIRVFVRPPAGAVRWRVLRKLTDDFTGADDANAVRVYDGLEPVFLDTNFLTNGLTYYYRPYYLDGDWLAGESKSAVPSCSFQQGGVDPQELLRDRFEYGFAELLSRGVLNHPDGAIKVLTAPPPADGIRFPVVTVTCANDASSERSIGEQVIDDEFDLDDWEWESAEGWLSRIQLTVVAWSLNPDERIAFRKAIKHLVMANLPVLAAHGIVNVDVNVSDQEDFQSFNAPIYQAVATVSCVAPSYVSAVERAITDVVVTTI